MAKKNPSKLSGAPKAVPAPTDERVRRSKELVMKATWELLVESGLSGVSVDEVSRRSGVAKTTVYRHWRTRSDLVFDACAQINVTQQLPDSGSLDGDLTILLLNLAHMLRSADWAKVLPSIVDAAERDAELGALFSRQQLQRAAPFLQVIERAKKAGKLSAKADAGALVAQLIGPLFYRRWFSREPIDEKLVKSVVKAVTAR